MKEIFQTISSSIHRLDSSILAKDLPPMQQAVLHLRQTKTQSKLYRAFKTHRNKDNNNFFDQYSQLFPVNNHPACLLMRSRFSNKDNLEEGVEDESEQTLSTNNEMKWWEKTSLKDAQFRDIKSGYKIILLLQILAHADMIGKFCIFLFSCF